MIHKLLVIQGLTGIPLRRGFQGTEIGIQMIPVGAKRKGHEDIRLGFQALLVIAPFQR